MIGKILCIVLLGFVLVQSDPLWRREKRSPSDKYSVSSDGVSSPSPNKDTSTSPDEDITPSPDVDSAPLPDDDSSPSLDEDSTPSPDKVSSPSSDEDSTPSPDVDSATTPNESSTPSPNEDFSKPLDENSTPSPDTAFSSCPHESSEVHPNEENFMNASDSQKLQWLENLLETDIPNRLRYLKETSVESNGLTWLQQQLKTDVPYIMNTLGLAYRVAKTIAEPDDGSIVVTISTPYDAQILELSTQLLELRVFGIGVDLQSVDAQDFAKELEDMYFEATKDKKDSSEEATAGSRRESVEE